RGARSPAERTDHIPRGLDAEPRVQHLAVDPPRSTVALTALGILIMCGAFTRAATIAAFALFTYVEFTDVTNYLNHYYLVTLLLGILCFLPAGGAYSFDARFFPSARREYVPRWMHWLLRFQIACVYFWAGMAKFGSDWLLHAQPLNIWLLARQDTPLLGQLFDSWHAALLMSWGGFLFDTTIWLFLLWPKTRRLAYVVVLGFHFTTGVLFNIGMFPVIMVCAATVFFDPSWPRRLTGSAPPNLSHARPRALAGAPAVAVALFCAVQLLMPARHWLYPGDVLWTEEGMRWSWKVMVREKNGAISYRVRWDGRERDTRVAPTRYLTDHQAREFSGQPDMILRLAHHIGRDFEERGFEGVEVRVDAKVSLNGRPPMPMINPDVNLMNVQDSVGPASWLMPGPTTAPPHLGRR
ncbi:MAG: HTTM domain-containing protein, partial [Myxococcota bacterium]